MNVQDILNQSESEDDKGDDSDSSSSSSGDSGFSDEIPKDKYEEYKKRALDMSDDSDEELADEDQNTTVGTSKKPANAVEQRRGQPMTNR